MSETTFLASFLRRLRAQVVGSPDHLIKITAETWDTVNPLGLLARETELDAAWAEAEALVEALRNPKDAPHVNGWGGPSVYHFEAPSLPGEEGPYGAKVSPPWDEDGTKSIYAYGPTPAAALRELAARLREVRG
jgi:hypothetical protein